MNNLESMRIQAGMTQGNLASCAGISQNYLSELEKGAKKNPSMQVIRRLAAALNCSIDDLYKEDNDDEQ